MDISELSDKQLAGQRLMVGFDGTNLNSELKHLIKTIKVGGVILFSRNISTATQVEDLCSSIQKFASSCNQPPLFIAVDQEGGEVARLKKPFTQFPGNSKMRDENDAMLFAMITAAELNKTGINMNMAPVLDVTENAATGIMKSRSFGNDPAWVSQLGTKVIEHLQHGNVMAVAKHFPGIGSTVIDSHIEMPVEAADMNRINAHDLIPFKEAVKHDVAGIMLSHILYKNIDPDWPASLSYIISKKLLRDKMKYKGLVLTDDLDMRAITKHFDIKQAVSQIQLSDIDLILICQKKDNIKKAFNFLLKSFKDSSKLKKKGLESVERIMESKNEYIGIKI